MQRKVSEVFVFPQNLNSFRWALSLWILHPTEQGGRRSLWVTLPVCAVSCGLGESQPAGMFVTNSASEHSSTHFLKDLGLLLVAFLVLPLTLKVLDVVLHSSVKKAKGLLDLKINSAGRGYIYILLFNFWYVLFMYVNEEKYLYVAFQCLKCMPLFCQVNKTESPSYKTNL